MATLVLGQETKSEASHGDAVTPALATLFIKMLSALISDHIFRPTVNWQQQQSQITTKLC